MKAEAMFMTDDELQVQHFIMFLQVWELFIIFIN